MKQNKNKNYKVGQQLWKIAYININNGKNLREDGLIRKLVHKLSFT